QRAGNRCPPVIRASPVGQRTPGATSGSARHSASKPGPAARWIAPSTPPPPSSDGLAALTIASTASAVMSPSTTSTRITRPCSALRLQPRVVGAFLHALEQERRQVALAG